MREADAAIDRALKTLENAVEEITRERDAAMMIWRETGSQSHMEKAGDYNEDLGRLSDQLNAQRELARAKRRVEKYARMLRIYKTGLENLLMEYPGDDQAQQIIGICRSRLETARLEAGLKK